MLFWSAPVCAWAATPTLCAGCAHNLKGPEPGSRRLAQNRSVDCWQQWGAPCPTRAPPRPPPASTSSQHQHLLFLGVLPLTQRVLAPGGGAWPGGVRFKPPTKSRQPKAVNTNDPKPPQAPTGPSETRSTIDSLSQRKIPIVCPPSGIGSGNAQRHPPPPRLGPAACVDSGVLSGPTGR